MGFDIECIQNIQSLAGEYFCPVCRLLVYPDEALQTQCTHLYCKPCLAYVVSNTHTCPYDGYPVTEAETKPLKESNQALAETIGQIAVTCLYHRSGCTWQGLLSESTAHCAGCSFGNSPVMCNRCGAHIVHRQVLEHSQICLGEQPLAQQVANAPAAAEQGQAATPAGATASQDQNSQNVTAPATGQGQSQAAVNAQPQAVAQAPTPEQWYQQQQQYYQQYYQQYPGYDPYQQQYQQYAQYQQQQLQAHPQQQVIQGQPHPQPYMQPQHHPQPQAQAPAQPQPQPQPQPQAQPQPQPQPQPISHPQAQPQAQPQPQPQQHPQPQMAVQPHIQPQINPQQQLHGPVQPHPQLQPQTHPPPQPQMQSQQLGHPHPQPHPQAHPQSHPQQHSQMPQHPQPHSQMPHLQPHLQHPPQQQPQLHPHVHPQPHLQHPPHMQLQQPQPHPHPQAHLQPQPQPHNQPPPHFQPQPQPQPQPQSQPQSQHPPAHAVTGHQSYPQARPHQQMLPGAAQQHPMHAHPQPQGAAHQPPQHPGQFPPQQPPQMRPHNPPPQSHAPMQHPQQPAIMPAQGQLPNVPPVQQQPAYHQAHHPVQQIHHHPGMQLPQHQPVPHQQAHGLVHQPQPFPGPAPASVHNQPHQQGPFVPQQPIQQPQQSLRPQAPPSLQQHTHAHPQWQQNIPSAQGVLTHQSQSHAGRPMMPSHAAMHQSFPHPSSGTAGPTHVQDARVMAKPGQHGADQLQESSMPRSGNQTASLGLNPGTNAPQVSAADASMKPTHEDSLSEKISKVPELEAEAVDTEGTDVNDSVTARSDGADSAELKIPKSENILKSGHGEENPLIETEYGDASAVHGKDVESSAQNIDSEEPLTKQTVKEETTEQSEPSPSAMSSDTVNEDKGVASKQDESSLHVVSEVPEGSLHENLSSQPSENLEGQNVKTQHHAADPQMPQSWPDARSAIPRGHVPGNERSSMHASTQHLPTVVGFDRNPLQQPPHQNVGPSHERPLPRPGYNDGNMPQFHRQGPGPDEYRGLPPAGQIPSRNFTQPAHPVPIPDQERYQQMPMPYGQHPHMPDHGPQRPPAPDRMLPTPLPLPGPNQERRLQEPPPHQTQVQGQLLAPMRPQGPQQGRPSIVQHPGSLRQEVPPGSMPYPGMSASFGKEPGHFGLPQRSFEPRPGLPQGHNQGHMALPHAGGPRFSQGEPFSGPPPGPFESPGGMMARGPQGPEGQIGRHHPSNPMEAEMFANKRPGFFDGRQHDPHLPLSAERVPFGQSSGTSMMKINGVPGKGLVGGVPDASFPHGAQEERFKPFPEERHKPILEEGFKLPPEEQFNKPFSLEHGRRTIDRREFEEDLKQFPRPSHLDGDNVPKFENHFSSSRHFDRGQHGFGMDRPHGFGRDAGPDAGASFPVGSGGPSVHPVDIGERSRPIALHDNMGKKIDPAGAHTDILGPVSEFGRHRMDLPPPRSPGRDYPGFPSRRFGSNSAGLGLGSHSRLEDFDGREPHAFGSGPLPSHLRRGELDGPRNLRIGEQLGSGNLPVHLRSGELVGPDIVPSHLRGSEPLGPGGHMRSGEPLGPRHLSSHLRIGEPLGPDQLRMLEPTGFGGLPSHLRMGELAGPGNLPPHLRIGEPGFGSSLPMYGLPNESGFFNQDSIQSDMESFDHPRKRKPGSMGWCRICKIDCETVEGLDLHSQTREHQKMAMDMVLSIKQDNAKKQKVSSEDRVSLEDANKSRKAGFESRGNRH